MGKKRILIVDERMISRFGLKYKLEKLNFDVTDCGSIGAAMREGTDFDGFIIMETVSAPQDGAKWAKELMKNGHKVVVMPEHKIEGKIPYVETDESECLGEIRKGLGF